MKKSLLQRILSSGFFKEQSDSVVGVDLDSSSIKGVKLLHEVGSPVLKA